MKRPSRRLLLATSVGGLIALGAVWLLITYQQGQQFAAVGDIAPNITTVTAQTQAPFTMESLRGKPILLNFFTPWCQPCIQETPDLIAFAKHYDKQIDVVMIDRGDTAYLVKQYIQKYNLPATITVLLDPDNRWSAPFGVTGQPETFLISPDGHIKSHLIGPLSEAELVHYATQAGMHR